MLGPATVTTLTLPLPDLLLICGISHCIEVSLHAVHGAMVVNVLHPFVVNSTEVGLWVAPNPSPEMVTIVPVPAEPVFGVIELITGALAFHNDISSI